MKNFLHKGFAKKAIILAFVLGVITPSALALQSGGLQLSSSALDLRKVQLADSAQLIAAVAPTVQNLNVATSNGTATVSFNVNTEATATVWIKDTTDTIVKTLAFDKAVSTGNTYSYPWNGTNNSGQSVAAGSYKAQVVVYNSVSSDIENNTFTYSTGSVVEAPQVSVSASPTSFYPENGETTDITYTLSEDASLKVEVKSGSSIIRTLRSQSLQSAGTYHVTWDGKNSNGTIMSPNGYTVEVYASNTAGNDTAITTVTVLEEGQNQNAPNITSVYATPSTFDPDEENTRIYFTIDRTADVTVRIMDGSSTIRTLLNDASLSSGTYYYEWNGRNSSGNEVSEDSYTARVDASNSYGSDTETTSVRVDFDGGGSSCELITSHFVNPSHFDPEDRDVQIYYNLSRTAEVTVRIKDGSRTIRTLVNNKDQSSGQRIVSWNGRDYDGDYVSDDSYKYEIEAYTSSCGEDIEFGYVRVDRDGDDDYESDWPSTDENLIRDLRVINEIFDPRDGERARIEFELTDRADLKVEVLDGRKVVETLRDVRNQSSGDYSYSWDGRDSDGDIVNDDLYQFRVMADNDDDTDTDRAYVEVDTDGRLIGFPDGDRCAGFKDVSINSPFCKAIELMSKRKIFEGYSDGTFRPYEKINRAETTKVVTLALGYDIDTGAYYGRQYKDTIADAWYSPYLDVAKRHDIATGYPDGTFRPASTINRVELLRIFLEGNGLNLPSCSVQPFTDTPLRTDTNWYMKYACYAKNNGLMNSEYSNNLYPAEAMTRGDVADLFYDFEVKGLYSRYVRDRAGYDRNDDYRRCVEYDRYGDCTRYDNYNDNYDTRRCVEYDRYGDCTRYEYYDKNNDSDYRYCVEYDRYGDCSRYSSYYDDYYNDNDGYYVYRDGRYVWVNY